MSPQAQEARAKLRELRAEFSVRCGGQATAQADAWFELRQTFKASALKLASLDPKRACMPIETFEPSELIAIAYAAEKLLAWSQQLVKAVAR